MDHGDMDMGDGDSMQCNMNMLFTWDTTNLCIVFSSWRITDNLSLILSLIGVMALTAGYEAVREASRRYESGQASTNSESHLSNGTSEYSSLLGPGNGTVSRRSGKLVRAAFYGVQVFYSFFIMLLFMTYNGWIMLAVGFGAFLGYLLFGNSTATKSAACH